MDLSYLREHQLILLDCISGSKAYGLDTANSDTDKRGLFFLPKKSFFASESFDSISNASNDESYTELGKFFDLLSKSNPTMIELLNTPKDSVLFKHHLMDKVVKELYLSKECEYSFAGYAMAQIKKAKGLNKKIVNPLALKRKTVLDFCQVTLGSGTVKLTEFLSKKALSQEHCGLSKLSNVAGMYALCYSENEGYKGVVQKESSNEVSLSSIEKGADLLAYLYFNKDAYSVYCKQYLEYWAWVEKRNDARYQNTLQNGKNYDVKNMMHTFRLLEMAHEIALEGEVNVWRKDRELLLKIKTGDFEYDDLMKMADEKCLEIKDAFAKCDLPMKPNVLRLKHLLVEFREKLYGC
jgi:uncharacterized protein